MCSLDRTRPYRLGTVPDHPLYLASMRVRDALVAAGLAETRPMPFTKGSAHTQLARVANPLADDEPFLRDSILDTLARRAEFNLNQHEGNVRIFEIGSVFEQRGGTPPVGERLAVGALIMGARRPAHFTEAKPPESSTRRGEEKALAERIPEAAFPCAPTFCAPVTDGLLWTVVASDPALPAPEGFGADRDFGEVTEDGSIMMTRDDLRGPVAAGERARGFSRRAGMGLARVRCGGHAWRVRFRAGRRSGTARLSPRRWHGAAPRHSLPVAPNHAGRGLRSGAHRARSRLRARG